MPRPSLQTTLTPDDLSFSLRGAPRQQALASLAPPPAMAQPQPAAAVQQQASPTSMMPAAMKSRDFPTFRDWVRPLAKAAGLWDEPARSPKAQAFMKAAMTEYFKAEENHRAAKHEKATDAASAAKTKDEQAFEERKYTEAAGQRNAKLDLTKAQAEGAKRQKPTLATQRGDIKADALAGRTQEVDAARTAFNITGARGAGASSSKESALDLALTLVKTYGPKRDMLPDDSPILPALDMANDLLIKAMQPEPIRRSRMMGTNEPVPLGLKRALDAPRGRPTQKRPTTQPAAATQPGTAWYRKPDGSEVKISVQYAQQAEVQGWQRLSK